MEIRAPDVSGIGNGAGRFRARRLKWNLARATTTGRRAGSPRTICDTLPLAFKSWMASVVLFFALVQLITALRLWGRISWPETLPAWFGQIHRLSGTLAFLATIPVAYHCLWAIGFEPDISQPRRFAHSLLGCPVHDDGARIFAARCSGCHGAQGQGLSGPQLAGRVVERFPDPAAEAAIIANGGNGMPAFGSRLTAEELNAVVEFTRTRAGRLNNPSLGWAGVGS